MSTPEEKYYDGMNTLLAPVRWAKSLVQTVLLIGIVIVIGLAYPLIVLCGGFRDEGTPLTALLLIGAFMVSILTILTICTFFYTPWYTIVGGVISICTLVGLSNIFPDSFDWARPNNSGEGFGFKFLVLGFLLTGWLIKGIRTDWDIFTKYGLLHQEWLMNILKGSPNQREQLNAPTAAEVEERDQRQRERERKRQQAEERKQIAEAKERQQFLTENREVFSGIKHLLSTCSTPAIEIMRAAGALEGRDLERNPKDVVWTDVADILAIFSRTSSTGDVYIEKLWEEVTRRIKPTAEWGALCGVPISGVKQLGMVYLLAEYDKRCGTTFSSKAASTYLAIVSAVSAHCDGSLAVNIVADTYTELLRPYNHESGRGEHSGRTATSAGSHSDRKSVCRKCIEDYGLLGLPVGASKNEIGQKRRDCADVLHPDKLSGKSERARNAAEQQMKIINAACDRLISCKCAS